MSKIGQAFSRMGNWIINNNTRGVRNNAVQRATSNVSSFVSRRGTHDSRQYNVNQHTQARLLSSGTPSIITKKVALLPPQGAHHHSSVTTTALGMRAHSIKNPAALLTPKSHIGHPHTSATIKPPLPVSPKPTRLAPPAPFAPPPPVRLASLIPPMKTQQSSLMSEILNKVPQAPAKPPRSGSPVKLFNPPPLPVSPKPTRLAPPAPFAPPKPVRLASLIPPMKTQQSSLMSEILNKVPQATSSTLSPAKPPRSGKPVTLFNPPPPVSPKPTRLAPPVSPKPTRLAPPVSPKPTRLAPPVSPKPTRLAPPVSPKPTRLAPPVSPKKTTPLAYDLQRALNPPPLDLLSLQIKHELSKQARIQKNNSQK